MNGFELCDHIRKNKEVPILIVSAKNEEIDKIRAFNLGADDYITKPFSPSELVARAKAHLMRYVRLMGKQSQVQAQKFIFAVWLSINRREGCSYAIRRSRSQPGSLTCWNFWLVIRTGCLTKRNCLNGYGAWNPAGILPP